MNNSLCIFKKDFRNNIDNEIELKTSISLYTSPNLGVNLEARGLVESPVHKPMLYPRYLPPFSSEGLPTQ
jgi:hypothetical protein